MTEPQFTQDDIDTAIRESVEKALAAQQKAHEDQLQVLRDSIAGGATVSAVPANSGGPGTDIQPTWSLYDQTLAAAGEHPLQQEAT
jgi:hypothetical protein